MRNLLSGSNIPRTAWRRGVRHIMVPVQKFWMLRPLFIWPKSVCHMQSAEVEATELNRAEASLGWMCERRATAKEGVPDEDLMKPTDDEIEACAVKLVTRAHEDELHQLDEEIASLAQ